MLKEALIGIPNEITRDEVQEEEFWNLDAMGCLSMTSGMMHREIEVGVREKLC